MGYVLRVRFASFFTGAAAASMAGVYILNKDYKAAHQSISQKMNNLYDSLDSRVLALEKLKEIKTTTQVGGPEAASQAVASE